MIARHVLAVAALGALAFGLAKPIPAHALSMSECSAKYQAAKSAGTLNGMKWNDFRKAECGADASATPAAAPAGQSLPALSEQLKNLQNQAEQLARALEALQKQTEKK